MLQSCTTPCQFDMWKHADIPRSDVTPTLPPLLTEPSATELYYTKSVWYVKECRCTQVRCNPLPRQSNQVLLQNPATPCQFHMWNSAGIPRSNVYPPLVNPSVTESYHTQSVWHVEECRHTKVRCTPPTNSTQCYRTVLHHVSLICLRMQIYPGQM